MNSVENKNALDLFIQNSIEVEHGSKTRDAYEAIVCTMCNKDSVRGSIKAAPSKRSSDTYKKNYHRQNENKLK